MKPVIFRQVEQLITKNSTTILTALGISGGITTAILSAKAGYKSALIIEAHEHEYGLIVTKREKIELVWQYYIPAAVSGGLSIASIIASNKIGARKTAAITAAYSLSEKAFVEYKDKVTETLGDKKEKQIRDDIAQDRVNTNPPSQIVIGSGPVLCCDLFTGRYFNSDMEKLRKAQNDLNSYLMRHDRATISHFYDLIGLPHTSYSWDVGWTSDKLVELDFSTVLSEDKKPCLAFDFNYTKVL
jgi:hypothetical protein